MAEDGLISAMWHSLVSTFEYCESAGDVESSARDVKAYYAEAEDEASVEMQQALHDSLEMKDIYCLGDQGMAGYGNQVIDTMHDSSKLEIDSIKAPQYSSASSSPVVTKRLYRVPKKKGKAREDYSPRYMSIGPYHNNQSTTKDAEWDKYDFYVYLRRNGVVYFSECRREIQAIESKLRDYYVHLSQSSADNDETKTKSTTGLIDFPIKESIKEMTSKEFARCMFLDACFILVHFRIFPWSWELNRRLYPPADTDIEKPDPTITRAYYDYRGVSDEDIIHDINLMENQIPFAAIQKVYDVSTSKNESSLRNQVVGVLDQLLLQIYPTALKEDNPKIQEFEHFLHYYHMYFIPSVLLHNEGISPSTVEDKRVFNRWRRATDLDGTGISLRSIRKNSSESRSLLDIEFENGVLRIPTLVVDRHTNVLFRNILAFERALVTYGPTNWHNNYFTAYIKFVADLVTTSADVTVLAKKNILQNNLGKDEEILDLFCELKKEINIFDLDDSYLTDTFNKLEKFHDSSPKKWMVEFKRKYLRNPWVIMGVVAGTIALVSAMSTIIHNLKRGNGK